MSEIQDLSKSVCGSIEATGTKSCCVSPSQPPSLPPNKEVVCDGDICTIRFKDPPVEEKSKEESTVKVEDEGDEPEGEGDSKVEGGKEGGKEEGKDESKKPGVQLTGLDQLFSSLLGSVFKGGPGGPGLGGLGAPGTKKHRRKGKGLDQWKLNLDSDEESDSSRSEEEEEDYEEDEGGCDPDCRNALKWRSLDRLLKSHANLTRVLVDLWESERSD